MNNMVKRIKSRYYKSPTVGKGSCWYCLKSTNWIFEDNKDDSETFCCNSCFIGDITDFKGKRRIMRNLYVKNKQKGMLQTI